MKKLTKEKFKKNNKKFPPTSEYALIHSSASSSCSVKNWRSTKRVICMKLHVFGENKTKGVGVGFFQMKKKENCILEERKKKKKKIVNEKEEKTSTHDIHLSNKKKKKKYRIIKPYFLPLVPFGLPSS